MPTRISASFSGNRWKGRSGLVLLVPERMRDRLGHHAGKGELAEISLRHPVAAALRRRIASTTRINRKLQREMREDLLDGARQKPPLRAAGRVDDRAGQIEVGRPSAPRQFDRPAE